MVKQEFPIFNPPSHILALSSLQNEIEILNIHLMQEKSQKDVLRASSNAQQKSNLSASQKCATECVRYNNNKRNQRNSNNNSNNKPSTNVQFLKRTLNCVKPFRVPLAFKNTRLWIMDPFAGLKRGAC